MTDQHPVERLALSGPDLEIWWDSSPLIFEEWAQDIPERTCLFEQPGSKAGDSAFGPASLLQGATTNPPLTLQVIEKEPDRWKRWLNDLFRAEPSLAVEDAMWRLYIEIAALGADKLKPVFEASGYRHGYICCQVDPRDMVDLEAMLAQARRIHSARPNLMVKIPGTQEGIEAVRILSADGIPTNVTLGFTVSQLVAVGEAAKAGLAEARERGTNLCYWRSCAVMMLGRYEGAPPMQAQAKERDIDLNAADLRWAGIAIFQKAHRIFVKRGYPSKLMAASMRLGPTLDGKTHIWHLEKLAGANAVLTVFPNVFESFIDSYDDLPFEPQIDELVPGDVLKRLLQIPYFAEAYDERGIAPDDFVKHAALQATAESFSKAMERIQIFTTSCIV